MVKSRAAIRAWGLRALTEEGRRSAGKNSRSWRANERARKILAEHHPKPLTDDQEKEIDRIALEAQRKAVEKGPYSMSGE